MTNVFFLVFLVSLIYTWPYYDHDLWPAEDLGMTHSQRFHMGILIHVLYSNPKVLYAPNNTELDSVIKKVKYQLIMYGENNSDHGI